MIELHNQFGQIDIAKIADQTDAIIELPHDAQEALSGLIDAAKARELATERQSAATKRMAAATVAEHDAIQALADASMPIPFSTAKAEATKGGPLNAAELKSLREAHELRCREHLADLARRAASGVSNADGVATLGADGKWTTVVPTVSKAHAKTKGPASFKIALDKCEAELIDARAELTAATGQARRTSLIEADALSRFQSLQPRPSQDDLLRDAANRSQDRRAANIAAGLNPNQQYDKHGEPAKPTQYKSPLDVVAIQRPRGSGPLRSPVQRRVC
jgi:hypothetical protein